MPVDRLINLGFLLCGVLQALPRMREEHAAWLARRQAADERRLMEAEALIAAMNNRYLGLPEIPEQAVRELNDEVRTILRSVP